MLPLTLGVGGLEGLALGLIVSILVVAFGTFVGVTLALQSFFGASSWAEVTREDDS
jgi:hypothetical protein